MTRILVTGGAGFIGSALIKALFDSDKDHKIIGYDNLSTGNSGNLSAWLSKPNFDFKKADMLDSFSLKEAVEKSDVVFHLAASSDVSLGEANTKIDFEQNVVATYNLLDAMKNSQKCKRIVFASTSTVYGEVRDKPISENYDSLRPISLYGSTKLACESLISGYCHMFRMNGTIARLANIVGPSCHQGVIYDFVSKLTANRNVVEILGDGKQNKSYLHLSDCIDALLTLFDTPEKESPEIYNVGSDDKISVSEISDIIIQELGISKVERRYIDNYDGRGWLGDVREFLLDSTKLKNLGWIPKYNSKEAIILTVRDFLKSLQI